LEIVSNFDGFGVARGFFRSRALSLPKPTLEKAMAALIQSRDVGAPGLLGALIARLTAFAAYYRRGLAQRQALDELARLDDRMLRDIGLVRSDVDAALSLPPWRDRVAFLAARQARSKPRFGNRYD
jgi:uncharacterized protein YjiS (DUF1127 family)